MRKYEASKVNEREIGNMSSITRSVCLAQTNNRALLADCGRQDKASEVLVICPLLILKVA